MHFKKFILMNDMKLKTISTTRYQPPAIQKAFQLLKVVAAAPEGLGVSELALRLGLGKSTVYGLAKALLSAGALYQDPRRKKYSLGAAIVELAFRNWNYIRIGEQVQPFLEELRDRIGETVFLGVLSQTSGIIVATAESHNPLKISSPAGTSIPLLAGAVGKVFLAQLEEREALRIIREQGLPVFTPKSIVAESRYLEELALVRSRNYARDDEEYLPGVKAVATALGNHRGLPLALWVVAFAGSLEEERIKDIISEIMATADKLRASLDRGI